jgi:enoyl-CoA hydratase
MLSTHQRAGVTVVQLEHGPVNVLDLELVTAIEREMQQIDTPVVMTGAGRAFSAGVDLRRIVEEPDEYVHEFLDALSRAFLAVFNHPRPTVAAVNGHAIAGGCLFALCCDARLMSSGTIGLTELAVGVPFPRAGLEIVRASLGPAVRPVVLHAAAMPPAMALQVGILDEVCEPADLLDRAVEVAATLGGHPAQAYAATKRALHEPVMAALSSATDDAAVLWAAADTRERLAEHVARLAKPSA